MSDFTQYLLQKFKERKKIKIAFLWLRNSYASLPITQSEFTNIYFSFRYVFILFKKAHVCWSKYTRRDAPKNCPPPRKTFFLKQHLHILVGFCFSFSQFQTYMKNIYNFLVSTCLSNIHKITRFKTIICYWIKWTLLRLKSLK